MLSPQTHACCISTSDFAGQKNNCTWAQCCNNAPKKQKKKERPSGHSLCDNPTNRITVAYVSSMLICVRTGAMNEQPKSRMQTLTLSKMGLGRVGSMPGCHPVFHSRNSRCPNINQHLNFAPTFFTHSVESLEGPSAGFEFVGIRAYQGASCFNR